jgi:methylthioribose-1-phosphate isomerase
VALEWAKDGIRINSLHPDAVYDTALWTEELLAARAKAYNMTVEQYRKRNLLKTEVSSKDVAELAARCAERFLPRPPQRRFPSTAATSASFESRADPLDRQAPRAAGPEASPRQEEVHRLQDREQVAKAIKDMVVRGAPAIGCAACIWGCAFERNP